MDAIVCPETTEMFEIPEDVVRSEREETIEAGDMGNMEFEEVEVKPELIDGKDGMVTGAVGIEGIDKVFSVGYKFGVLDVVE